MSAYEITGKEKKVSDFEATNKNPSVDKIKGMAIVPAKEPVMKGVQITDLETSETYLDEIETGTYKYGDSIFKDNLRYTKLFRGAELDIAELGATSVGVLMHIISEIKMGKDEVKIDAAELAVKLNYSSSRSVYNGIFGLLKKEFIYRKTGNDGVYFINVNKFFNGNRVALKNKK